MEGTGARFARSAPRPGSLVNWRAVVARGPPAHSTEPAYPCCFPALQLRDQRERIAEGWVNPFELGTGTNALPANLPPGTNPGQLAALTTVTRVLLNLDEAITRE